MGKKRIAQLLARAGLSLSSSTVARRMKAQLPTNPEPPEPVEEPTQQAESSTGTVTASHPNQVWHVDFTTQSTAGGHWVPWFPFSLPSVWPFCWHIALVVDHFSRKILAVRAFRKAPTAEELCALLSRTVAGVGCAPKYVVSDQGLQFRSVEYRTWCRSHGVKPRRGAVGERGSIAIVERCIRSLKYEFLHRIPIPVRVEAMTGELERFVVWFNEHRPHQALSGRTPNEVVEQRLPAKDGPRWETRDGYEPKGGAPARAAPGGKLRLIVRNLDGRADLPVVQLQRVA
jgi:transposase InsO family protein